MVQGSDPFDVHHSPYTPLCIHGDKRLFEKSRARLHISGRPPILWGKINILLKNFGHNLQGIVMEPQAVYQTIVDGYLGVVTEQYGIYYAMKLISQSHFFKVASHAT